MIQNRTSEVILSEYVNGKWRVVPQLNILMNDRSKDWYVEIGKYLSEKTDKYKSGNKISKWYEFSKSKDYSFQAMMFLTDLDFNILGKMFGDPIRHDRFGEGMDKRSDHTYESYFITINNKKFHIGRDHRGTMIEVDQKSTPSEIVDCLKEFIDEYISI